MKKVLIASGVAVLAFAMVAGAQGYAFNTNLTVGSTGADVVALQTWLIANGYNITSISNGTAAKGYFGSMTAAAVKKYQAAKGIPATGFVGPLTRASLNSGTAAAVLPDNQTCPAGLVCTPVNTTPVAVACPAGYVCNPVGSTSSTNTGSITTPGVPGIIAVTQGPLSSSVMNVGSQMVPVLAIRVQAQYSDLSVQSLNLDLGNNTAIYNKLINKLYVTDGTNVLASQPLNSSTVIQSGSTYIIGIAGFNMIVPKGTYKDLIIKADINASVDSSYNVSGGSHYPTTGTGLSGITGGWGISVPANGLRAVDGAGLNLYGPIAVFSQGLTINSSLVDNAQANISLDASSPAIGSYPVTDTTNNQYLGLPVLAFNVNAQNDNLHIHQVKVRIPVTSGTGTLGAAYLYQGSTPIMSASVSGGIADFNNIPDNAPGASIPVNTTKTFTVKVDVSGVTSSTNPLVLKAGVATSTTADVVIYSSNNSTATVTGSALGYQQTVATVGPMFTLLSQPTTTKTLASTDQNGNATTTFTTTFNVQVQAIGTDVNLGLPASTTAAFNPVQPGVAASIATSTFDVYKNGVLGSHATYYVSGNTVGNLTVAYSQPTGTTLSADGSYFTVARNQTVTIPVTVTFQIRNAGSDNYTVQMQGINWFGLNSAGPTTFMANQPAWRSL